jgi:periplasmic protein CpxP/Spy
MKRLKILVVLCSFLTLLHANEHEEYHERNEHHIYKNLEYLNLDNTQYKKIKELLISYKKSYKKYHKQRKKLQKKLQEIIRKDSFNTQEYKNISKEIFQKGLELEINNLKKIHEILTPLQKRKFSYYLKEWRVE